MDNQGTFVYTTDSVKPEPGKKNLFTTMYFVIYLVLIFLFQYSANLFLLNKKCPSISNFYTVLFYFIPWVFIFMIMVCVLIVKSREDVNIVACFADVYGYLWVARKFNSILSETMYPTEEIKEKIEELKEQKSIEEKKIRQLQEVSMLIAQTAGKYYIFVNRFTPNNFSEMINLLTPLFRTGEMSEANQKLLYNQVVLRHNIGEFSWYMYTGLFVSAYVTYLILKDKCIKSLDDITDEMQGLPNPNDGPTTITHDYEPVL